MRIKNILIISLAAIALIGCTDSKEPQLDPATKADRQDLVDRAKFGVYRDSDPIFEFDRASHQLYSKNKGQISRMQSGTGDEYIEFSFAGVPVKERFVSGTMTITDDFIPGLSDLIEESGEGLSSVTESFYVLKQEGDLSWIWSDKLKFGALIMTK